MDASGITQDELQLPFRALLQTTNHVGLQQDQIPPHKLYLTREKPDQNMARWYTLSVEVTLFEDWACRRAYGRIGSRAGRVMLGLFASRARAEEELQSILRRKLAKGYRSSHEELRV